MYVVVHHEGEQPKLMLHRHKALGKFMQFGGHIELHENPWQALVRELREESGYDIKQTQLLQPADRITQLSGSALHPQPISYQTHQYGDEDHYHSDAAFALVTSEVPLHAIGQDESDQVQLFTVTQLKALTALDIHQSTKQTALFVLEVCYPKWHKVSPGDWQ
jgi:8-oxo-dGTP pyrophosphatase MutT (NUDIX family)